MSHISIPSDHAKGCKELSKYINAKFYCNEETYKALDLIAPQKYKLFEEKVCDVGNFLILPFKVYHDVENFGFLIVHKPTRMRILYITDTSNVDNLHFSDIDIFIIEANWDEDWEIKEDDFVKFKRTSSEVGHMSLQDTISFLKETVNINTKKVFLTHVSYECTDYTLFEKKARDALNFAEIRAINPKIIKPRVFVLHEDLDFDFN